GGSWKAQGTPNPGGRANGTLLAGSCGSATACLAVGNYFNGAGNLVSLAEAWNGHAWRIVPTPLPAGSDSSQLTGVWCTAATACIAVGYYTNSAGLLVPLAQAWNGHAWHIQATPAPSGLRVSGFLAIACSSASACTAVGDGTDIAGASLPLAERWNGHAWAIQATPAPSGAAATGLFAVSCAGAATCVATGDSQDTSGTTTTLAESWNGTKWSIKATPNPSGGTQSALTGVSCSSPQACIAGGYSGNAITGVLKTLAESWNGTKWSIKATPNPAGTTQSALAAMFCTSAKACTAVGAYVSGAAGAAGPDSGGGLVTLAETWNGSKWSIRATPNPAGATASQLTAVSCPSVKACVTAGSSAAGSGPALPLAERWNGSTWTLQPAPHLSGARNSGLSAVSCPAKSSCVAVGNFSRTPSVTGTLAETWNGTKWTIRPTPNPATSDGAFLQGISCTSASACIAVGFWTHGAKGPFILAETWNGSTWKMLTVPTPAGATGTSLYAISCSSASACTAVGNYRNKAGATFALAERWNGKSWQIQSVPRPASITYFYGVSCPSAAACVAAGYRAGGGGDAQPLAESWNGKAWSVQKVPLPAKAQGGSFAAVSCSSATACTATGTIFALPGGAFADRWNGHTWQAQVTPNPPGSSSSHGEISFSAVSCGSAGSCSAVGNFTPNGGPASFIESWAGGSTWKVQTERLPAGSLGSQLGGVSCLAAACTATGFSIGTAQFQVTVALVTGR
ncbi:MAG TPA: hypothetical protein VGI74_06015, partial [Streptosporangiaceae bacterium]